MRFRQHYFNTSHVNVNHRTQRALTFGICYFNTSHVNVNHFRADYNTETEEISIHLMLMLINPFDIRYHSLTQFQYISC